ncbi:MAG: hypothetical protein RLZ83_909, partial [Pseudomonadota bacterium]
MRWIRYTPAGGSSAYGLLEPEGRIRGVCGTPFDPIETSGAVHRLQDVKIEVPLVPRTFYAAGLNYVKHIREYAEKTGAPVNIPPQADIG